ncbi:MAG: hypothetical protein Q4D16_22760 [Eubacteriales bacterium]|nr:hypothetical protein [Eubacteriales bacterium]
MKEADMEFKKLIYDLMNGSLDLNNYPVNESKYVENEFEEGKYCSKAYKEIYEANRRLCQRLGAGQEDKDVEVIINNFFEITECLCMKMYDYGAFFSKKDK